MKGKKDKGITQAARAVECPEGTLRLLERKGVVKPARDQWGRRLFGDDDILAARRYLSDRRPAGSDAAA